MPAVCIASWGHLSPNDALSEQQAKKKAKKEGNLEWIGRVVAVPAWKFDVACALCSSATSRP